MMGGHEVVSYGTSLQSYSEQVAMHGNLDVIREALIASPNVLPTEFVANCVVYVYVVSPTLP